MPKPMGIPGLPPGCVDEGLDGSWLGSSMTMLSATQAYTGGHR